jgi:four helix bundle protein
MTNPIVDKTFQFSLEIIAFCEVLEGSRKYVVSNQLLKSGTSVGANVIEAQNAESKADFIHKMKIAAKEANEANYWLRICKFAPSYPDSDSLLEMINEIGRILTKIIATSKSK